MAKGITQAGPAAVDFQEGPSSSMVGMRASCASLARLRIGHPYCMAGPTYEVLFQASWTPESGVQIEVMPGASAINACAALVVAPSRMTSAPFG